MKKCNKTIKHISVASAARRGIIGGGGGGAPIHKNRRRRRPRNVGGGGAARPAQGSKYCLLIIIQCYAIHKLHIINYAIFLGFQVAVTTNVPALSSGVNILRRIHQRCRPSRPTLYRFALKKAVQHVTALNS